MFARFIGVDVAKAKVDVFVLPLCAIAAG